MNDLKYAKRIYCYLKRGSASIKRETRRKTRRSIKYGTVEVDK